MKYPDTKAYEFVVGRLADKGVTLNDIAHEAYLQQLRFNPNLAESDCQAAIVAVLHKREILNNAMVALEMDRLATEGAVAEPLRSLLMTDNPNVGTDEMLAISCSLLYGSVATAQFGHLDLVKHGLAHKLDTDEHGECNTFIDDIVSALISCVEAKVMHHNA